LNEILKSGRLGKLLSVRAVIGEFLPNWHRYEDYRTMYAARADLGGGVILSQIHEFDYLFWFFGAPRRLFSVGGHFSSLELDVEDTASTLMECVFEGRALPVHISQDYLQRPAQRTCEVVGETGRVLIDFQAPSLTVWYDGNAPEIDRFEGFERNELFMRELQHFLSCVSERAKPTVDLRDGFESLRIALAVKESIATGSAVELSHGGRGLAGTRI
jgi:predicted dehydrogenase